MGTWDLMNNWNLILPPSRPSAVQLSNIRSLSSHIDRSEQVAILGSTPEFRDLLFECGFENIYVLEKTLSFYEAMSKARIYHNHETIVEGDWLSTLPNYKSIFKLILSDLTSGNISYEYHSYFYHIITDSLSSGGIFFDKILTHPGQNIIVDELIRKYSFLPLNLLYINYFSCEMLFCSELLDIGQIVDTSLFYSILEEKIDNKRVLSFAEGAKMITPPDCKWFYGKKWDQFKKDYCSDLKIIQVDEDEESSPYFGRLKFYAFVKR